MSGQREIGATGHHRRESPKSSKSVLAQLDTIAALPNPGTGARTHPAVSPPEAPRGPQVVGCITICGPLWASGRGLNAHKKEGPVVRPVPLFR